MTRRVQGVGGFSWERDSQFQQGKGKEQQGGVSGWSDGGWLHGGWLVVLLVRGPNVSSMSACQT